MSNKRYFKVWYFFNYNKTIKDVQWEIFFNYDKERVNVVIQYF